VVYAFQVQVRQGENPVAGLIDIKGKLYGTNNSNGKACYEFGRCGTVFSVNRITGSEHTLHVFGNGTDGAIPEAGLIDVKGTLYGTTYFGGGGTGCNCKIHSPNNVAEINAQAGRITHNQYPIAEELRQHSEAGLRDQMGGIFPHLASFDERSDVRAFLELFHHFRHLNLGALQSCYAYHQTQGDTLLVGVKKAASLHSFGAVADEELRRTVIAFQLKALTDGFRG
jgi:hypothetical protein